MYIYSCKYITFVKSGTITAGISLHCSADIVHDNSFSANKDIIKIEKL